jgi:hypothetical protein
MNLSPSPLSKPLWALDLQPYTASIDLWALGCLTGEMYNGRPMFGGRDDLETFKMVLDTLLRRPQDDSSVVYPRYDSQSQSKLCAVRFTRVFGSQVGQVIGDLLHMNPAQR